MVRLGAVLAVTMLGGLLAFVGLILLVGGTAAGGFNLAVGLATVLIGSLSAGGRQAYGFLGVLSAAFGLWTASSVLLFGFPWGAAFITVFVGVFLFVLGGFLIGEASDLKIPLE